MLEHDSVSATVRIPRTLAVFIMARLLGLSRRRREVLEELRDCGVDLAPVFTRPRNLVGRLPAPHELPRLRVHEIDDEVADRDRGLRGRRHAAAHSSPAPIAP